MDNKIGHKIELRHHEIEELLGSAPNWLIRWGITVFFFVLVTLFIGCYFFRYPQMVKAPVVITTEQPATWVVAKASGRLDSIYVENHSQVNKEQILAVIHNPAKTADFIRLKRFYEALQPFLSTFDIRDLPALNQHLEVGALQDYYAQLIKIVEEYRQFSKEEHHRKRILSYQFELDEQQKYLENMRQQEMIYKKNSELLNTQFRRDSALHAKKMMAPAEYEKSLQQSLSGNIDLYQSRINISNIIINNNKLKQAIIESEAEYRTQETLYRSNIQSACQQLHSQMESWEQTFLLKSPAEGIVNFSNFWGKNQNINAGEKSFAIVAHTPGDIVGRCQVPVTGSGKIKCGQNVIIKLEEFPYMEYGMLTGTVKNISLIPIEQTTPEGTVKLITIEIRLKKDFETTYRKKIPFTGELTGVAEISTKEMSLLEHFLNPLKYLWNKIE